MFYKNWPSWLKGGAIGVIIMCLLPVLILFFYQGCRFMDFGCTIGVTAYAFMPSFLVFFLVKTPTFLFPNKPFLDILIYGLIYNIFLGFVVGSFVGFFYEKIKNRAILIRIIYWLLLAIVLILALLHVFKPLLNIIK